MIQTVPAHPLETNLLLVSAVWILLLFVGLALVGCVLWVRKTLRGGRRGDAR